jgi:hypothetical protein
MTFSERLQSDTQAIRGVMNEVLVTQDRFLLACAVVDVLEGGLKYYAVNYSLAQQIEAKWALDEARKLLETKET